MLTGTPLKIAWRRRSMAARGTNTTASSSTSTTKRVPCSIPRRRRTCTGITTRPFGPTSTKFVSLLHRLIIAPNAPGSTELVARSALRAFACVHPGGGHPGGRRHTTARGNHERYPGPASFRRISSTRSEVAPARLRRWHASRSSGSVTFGIREMSSRSSFWVLTYRVGQATSVAGVEELSLSDRRAHPAPTSSWLRSRWPIR